MDISNFDEAIAALSARRDEYEVERNAYDERHENNGELRRAQLKYFAAMENAIMASPNGHIVRNYAVAATTAVHLLTVLNYDLAIGGAAGVTPTQREKVRNALAQWAVAERPYVALGYRAVTTDELQLSTRIPLERSLRAPVMFYDKVFVRRDEGEMPVLHAQAEIARFADTERDILAIQASHDPAEVTDVL
jgi:hypothetical protein